MFTRVIVDTGQWRVTIGALGLGAVQAVSQTGESVAATAIEKRYFMQVLQTLRSAGIPITSKSPVAVAVVTDFSKAIHQRFRRASTAGGFVYTVFFSTYSPEETARKFIEKFQGQAQS